MTREVLIALDQGSSGSRALAFDKRGRLLARSQFPVRTFCPRPDYFEHDAEALARGQERALASVLSRLPRSCRVRGIGVASQRSTVVLWDRLSGKPLARALSWQDSRAACLTAAEPNRQARVHELTGLYLTPYYSAPKIRWLIDHVPAVKRCLEAGRLLAGPVGTYLIWRLTRGEVFAADPTLAQRMMLMNLNSLDWDEEMIRLFSLPREILPSIRPSGGLWGEAKVGGRRIPIMACLGDQQAAAIGLGALAEGSTVINYGTGAFVLRHTGFSPARVPGLLASVGWDCLAGKSCFLQEGTVHAAASSFEWLSRRLGLLKRPEDLDSVCRSSRPGVWVLPALGGLGAPRWDYKTPAVFFGLNALSRPADIVRGTAEGIAFLVSDILEALSAANLGAGPVLLSGGLTRSRAFCQIQVNILGREAALGRDAEATALGAAIAAGRAAGLDGPAPPKAGRVLRSRLSAEQARSLRRRWNLFVEAQARLARDMSAS